MTEEQKQIIISEGLKCLRCNNTTFRVRFPLLVDCIFRGLTTAEVAKELGITKSYAYQTMERAKRIVDYYKK